MCLDTGRGDKCAGSPLHKEKKSVSFSPEFFDDVPSLLEKTLLPLPTPQDCVVAIESLQGISKE